MKQTAPKRMPAGAKVLPLRPLRNPAPVAPRALLDGRHHYFTNTNGRRWGR